MNGQLERYVLRELVTPFLAATLVLLSLFYAMVLVRGVDFLLGSAATPADWLMLGGSMLPMLLPQVLPIAFLLGVMIGFARLGEDGELTAMASVGISPARLARPALLLGGAVVLVLTFTVFVWKPWGTAMMRQTARAVIERNILGDLKPGTIRADLPGIVFHAEDVKAGPSWKNVLLIDERDGARTQVLSAPAAHATFEHGVGLALEKGVLVQRSSALDYTTTSFDKGTLLFNVDDALNRRDTFRFGHEELSPLDLYARARQAEAEAQPAQAYWSSFHFRLSQLVAPLALGLLATAIAQGGRKRAARTAALIALGTYLAYYVLVRVGVQLGEKSVLSPVLAGHAATAIAFLLGAALLWRVSTRGAT